VSTNRTTALLATIALLGLPVGARAQEGTPAKDINGKLINIGETRYVMDWYDGCPTLDKLVSVALKQREGGVIAAIPFAGQIGCTVANTAGGIQGKPGTVENTAYGAVLLDFHNDTRLWFFSRQTGNPEEWRAHARSFHLIPPVDIGEVRSITPYGGTYICDTLEGLKAALKDGDAWSTPDGNTDYERVGRHGCHALPEGKHIKAAAEEVIDSHNDDHDVYLRFTIDGRTAWALENWTAEVKP
jgi:hypothetical protein